MTKNILERKFMGVDFAAVKGRATDFVEQKIEQGFDLVKIKASKDGAHRIITVFYKEAA